MIDPGIRSGYGGRVTAYPARTPVGGMSHTIPGER